MSTFFGIEERDAQGFIDKHTVCLPHAPDGKTELHYVVSPIRKEDIVFIKHSNSPFDLHILAVGVVQSEYPAENIARCLPAGRLGVAGREGGRIAGRIGAFEQQGAV